MLSNKLFDYGYISVLIHQTFFTACSPLRIIFTVSKVDDQICIVLTVAKVDFLFGVVFRRDKVP